MIGIARLSTLCERRINDALAKWGVNSDGHMEAFQEIPSFLSNNLLADAMGTMFLRGS